MNFDHLGELQPMPFRSAQAKSHLSFIRDAIRVHIYSKSQHHHPPVFGPAARMDSAACEFLNGLCALLQDISRTEFHTKYHRTPGQCRWRVWERWSDRTTKIELSLRARDSNGTQFQFPGPSLSLFRSFVSNDEAKNRELKFEKKNKMEQQIGADFPFLSLTFISSAASALRFIIARLSYHFVMHVCFCSFHE